jgi:phosphosulfolactate synthase (CoM biosynthesis protein A)
MSELQTKIDTILQKRKVGVENIVAQEKVISDLKSTIFDIKKKIKEVSLENATSYVPRLEEAEKKLSVAAQKLEHLKNRFDRETINLGVSGVSHAGKSTLLQAITGLSNNEIPKAEEGTNYANPTTAVRSQIYNGDSRAVVKFRTAAEFVKMVNEYLAAIKTVPQISDLSDFERLDLSQVDFQKFIGNEKYNYDRVVSIKEAFKYFRNYLGGVPITISNFADLKKFVAYSYDSVEQRLYPAVSEVEIYCPFPSLDRNIKLGLIDLPGFGENSNVDKIMTDGLENDVDHAVLIIRPNQQDAGIRQRELATFSRIGEVQAGISKRSNFLSFLINKDERESGLDNLVNSTKTDIDKYFNNGGESFKTFGFPVLTSGSANHTEVTKMLNSILENLIDVLPKMDEELLENYKKTLDISDVRALLDEIFSKVEHNALESADEITFYDKAKNIREDISASLIKLLDSEKYVCSDEIDDTEFADLVQKIKSEVKADINETLLFVPAGRYKDWQSYAQNVFNIKGGIGGLQDAECHRLWVEIVKRYEKIDDFFNVKMEDFKKDIMKALKENTGNLIVGEGQEAITNLKNIMERAGLTENVIYNSIVYLETIRQDFRQNVYPFFLKDNVDKILIPEAKGGNAVFGSARDGNAINSTRIQLQGIATNANKEVADTILNYNVFNYFLYGTLENFDEIIIRSKDDDKDFIKFCSRFRSQLYPSEYGQESDNVKLQELKMLLTNAINLINKI